MQRRKDYSFETIGHLIGKNKETEVDEQLKELVAGEVTSWKDERNNALHERAKMGDVDTRSWDDRMAKLHTIPNAVMSLAESYLVEAVKE